MLAHRLLGGGSSSLSIPCPSLGSVLIVALAPVSGAPLSGALNPLSSCTRKQRGEKNSLASSAAPDFYPDSLQASHGALAPFRLYSRRQLQSSPQYQTEARASAPSPCPSRRVSRIASRAGECWSAPILCAGVSPLCPPHPCGCALLCGSEASPLHHLQSPPAKGLLVCGNLSSFTAPSHWCRSPPYSFVSVFSFFFGPTLVREEFLAFGEV